MEEKELLIELPGFEREVGWLYYIGKDNNIWRVKMNRKGRKKIVREVIIKKIDTCQKTIFGD